jgi:putative inorganic carbon (hco3(-)) transporter
MAPVSPAPVDVSTASAMARGADGSARRVMQWLICALPPALAMLYVPSLYAPFSAPKNALLIVAGATLFSCAAAAGLLRLVWQRAENARTDAIVLAIYVAVLMASWAASPRSDLGRQAVLLAVAGPILFVMSRAVMGGAEARLMLAIALAGAAQAAVALAQWAFGFDVFQMFGSSALVVGRMHVYGTLGNPDFVAGFIAACIPATVTLACDVRRWMRWTWVAIAAAEAAAIVGSGCRTGLFAAAIGAAVTLVLRAMPDRTEVKRRILLGTAFVVLMAAATTVFVWRNPRGAADAARGRLFLWEVASSQGQWRTLLGSGPGTFAYGYPARLGPVLLGHGDRTLARYIGYERTACNDFLQALIEAGWLGMLALIGVIALWMRRAGRIQREAERGSRRHASAAAALGAMAALLVASFFESPFQRAETWGLLWLWMSLPMALDWQPEPQRPVASPATLILRWSAVAAGTLVLGWAVIQPVIGSYWEGAGDRLENRHRYPEAAAAYRRALTHDRSLPNANYCLARSLALGGDLAGGLRASDTALRWVDEPELRLMRAYMRESLNDKPGAIDELTTALRIFPFSWKVAAELTAVRGRAAHPSP